MWNQMEHGQSVPAARRRARPDSVGDSGDSVEDMTMDSSVLEIEDIEAARVASRLDALAADDAAYEALTESAVDIGAATPLTGAMRHAQLRATIREFLKATPRSEPETLLTMPGPDGRPHSLTRASLTTAIDHLRPRMRQVIRLGIEERWPRQKVCAYLSGISMKTLERDQVEALDHLVAMWTDADR